MTESTQPDRGRRLNFGVIAWIAVGVLFMVGCIAPVGFLVWIPAAVLAAALIALGARSPRNFFPFVCGIGLTLMVLGVINGTYVVMLPFGATTVAGGIVFYAAFGPRSSHAEPPSRRG